jgi:hypothetical protein
MDAGQRMRCSSHAPFTASGSAFVSNTADRQALTLACPISP